MKYLLDTCFISELVKPAPNENVIIWLNNVPSESLFISVISIGEIRKGLNKLSPSKRKQKLTLWLNNLIEKYTDRILPIDLTISENWGIILAKAEKAGTPIPSIDSLLAATSYTHNLIMVTRNEKDFISSGIPTMNPWK
ncbi:MAG: type II toxin-antitoxin system VapC family toxin [bacterium]|nr:type II toxin-antitoxin system VapC family toxin [bacterium]